MLKLCAALLKRKTPTLMIVFEEDPYIPGEGLLSGPLIAPAQFYHAIVKLKYFLLAVAPNCP